MKKLRARIIALMMVIIGVSCTISIFITILSMNGFFEDRTIKNVFMGMATRDVILLMLLIITIGIWVYLVTHSATNPIAEISRALNRVADGDYDVEIDLHEKGREFIVLEKDFNGMVRKLKDNEYLHKDFSSNISHEFKTPLSIIKGYADLLAESDISEELKAYALMISSESSRLTTLTANLLRLSSIENSQINLKRTNFSLDEQIRQAVLSMDSKWIEKKLEMELELQDVTFNGDEELLNQVWLNILDNAIKFTENGGKINVILAVSKGEIVISVEDTGIGMDSETMGNIFRQFYRGNTGKRYEGSGLGLSLVQRIVQLHGGTVLVDSELGRGSNFTVTFPLKKELKKDLADF